MGMQLMPINAALIKKMTNEQLINEFNQSRQNIGLELLRMGAILVERKTRPYEGNFEQIIKQEFNFSSSRGFLLMKAWKERDSYIEKLHSSGVNYKQLESILVVPAEDRADFIEQEHPEDMTAREAMQAAREYKELKAKLTKERVQHAQKEKEADERYEQKAKEAERQRQRAELAEKQVKHLKEHGTQVIEVPDEESREEIERLRQEVSEAQERAEQAEAQAQMDRQLAHQLQAQPGWQDQTEEMERLKARLEESQADLDRSRAEMTALRNKMSLAVYSAEHVEYAKYRKSREEEYDTGMKALKWFGHLGEAPDTEPEVEEWIRCLLLTIEDKPGEMLTRRDEVETAMKKLQMFYDALTPGGLKRVK